MATEKKLSLSFKNAADKTVSFTLDNPKESLTRSEAADVMQKMIAADIFSTSGGSLTAVNSIAIIEKTTTELA
ncbi:MAG: DUF2922 domain-containing protein [bacterium]